MVNVYFQLLFVSVIVLIWTKLKRKNRIKQKYFYLLFDVKEILWNLRKEKKYIWRFRMKLPIDLSEVILANPSINFDDDDVNQSGDKNG